MWTSDLMLPVPCAVSESQRYCTVHCTGYMRNWPTSQLGAEGEAEADKESSHFSCLVAVGRVHSQTIPQANREVKVKPTEFITRCAMDGKFTFVDQRYIINFKFFVCFSCPTILVKVSHYVVTAKCTSSDNLQILHCISTSFFIYSRKSTYPCCISRTLWYKKIKPR